MARTYADLLKFQEAYGIPPEQSAGAFGVELPPPVVDAPIAPDAPMDLGGTLPPAHPGMLSDPGNLAGNEDWRKYAGEMNLSGPKGNLAPVFDATGKPIAMGPAALQPGPQDHAGTKALGQMVPEVPNNGLLDVMRGASDIVAPPSVDERAERAAKAAELAKPRTSAKTDVGADDNELAKAQALQAQAMGQTGAQRNTMGGGGGISQLSDKSALATLYRKTGEDPLERADIEQKQAASAEAQGGIMDAKEAGQRAVANEYRKLGYMDRLASEDAEDRLNAEHARQQSAEQELKRAEERIMAQPKDEGIRKIGQMIAYAMAGFGNALTVRHGGQPTDIVQQMMARDDASDERSYQKKVELIKRMKGDEQTKQVRLRQAEADKVANYGRRRGAALDAFESVLADNEANLTGAQHDFYKANTELLRSQRNNEYNTGIRRLTNGIKEQHVAQQLAAQNPFSQWTKADKEASTKHAESFIPTDDRGNGYTVPAGVYGDVAKLLAKRAERDQLLREQEADIKKLASQGVADRSAEAIAGRNADLDRVKNRALKIATIENVMSGNGAMSKDEAVMQLDDRAYGDATSLRADVLNKYKSNLAQARHESDRQKEQTARQFGGMKGKRAIAGSQMYFIPEGLNEGPAQNAPEGVSEIRGR